MPPTEKRKVPASALAFATGAPAIDEIDAGKPADGQTLYPFTVTARTAGVAMHPYWGPAIHDFGGMKIMGGRIPVDFCHDFQQVIGLADGFDTKSGALVCTGSLVSLAEDDRSAEIAKKSKAGVPYQCSIFTSRQDLVYEFVPEGASTMVNGQTVEGPVTIFRQWGLRGIAICPYGSDSETDVSMDFAEGKDEVEVSFFQTGKQPMTTATPPAAKPNEGPTPKNGAEFLTAFGDLGGRWFAEGKTFDECTQLFIADLQQQLKTKGEEFAAKLAEKDAALLAKTTEFTTLKEQFDKLAGGKPVSFAAADVKTPPAPKEREKSNLDKFAAGLEMPGAKAPDKK